MNPNGFIYTAHITLEHLHNKVSKVGALHVQHVLWCPELCVTCPVSALWLRGSRQTWGPLGSPGEGRGWEGELWGHKNGHGFPTILPHVCCHSLFKAVYMCMSNLINMYVTSFLAAAKSGWGPRGTELHLLLSTACIKGCGFLRCRKADPRSSLDLSLCVLNI